MQTIFMWLIQSPANMTWFLVHTVFVYFVLYYLLHCLKNPIKIWQSAFIAVILIFLAVLTSPIINMVFMHSTQG